MDFRRIIQKQEKCNGRHKSEIKFPSNDFSAKINSSSLLLILGLKALLTNKMN